MPPKAVLVGLPGSGKSAIGRRLAKALGVAFLDTDTAIEQHTGLTIAEIFAQEGEEGFRRIEQQIICAALTSHDGVLSLGGGAITSVGVREALAGHTVIFLEVSLIEGIRRTHNTTGRPLLTGPGRAEKYKELMDQRTPLYRRVATFRVDTNSRSPVNVVRYIVTRMNKRMIKHPKLQSLSTNPKALTKRITGSAKPSLILTALLSESTNKQPSLPTTPITPTLFADHHLQGDHRQP